MWQRNHFKEGAFIINAKKLKKTSELEKKIQTLQSEIIKESKFDLLYSLRKKRQLLIIDDAEQLIRRDKTRFNWLMLRLIQKTKNLKIVVITQTEIKKDDFQSVKENLKYLEIYPLNEIECVHVI